VTDVCFYFQVHQPFRLRHYTFFDIGADERYFDDTLNARILKRVAERCYVPMNEVLLRAIDRTAGEFRCAFSISGTALQQLESWAPEALESFQRLAATGAVEFLGETSHHSLAWLADPLEFDSQVQQHAARIEELFGTRPTAFRNTELALDDSLARRVEALGFRVLLGEGADHLLGWRSPHRVYRAQTSEGLKLLLRAYRLSDDIAFRFSDRSWSQWPLSAERYASWVHRMREEDVFLGLYMDYETFGEHQAAETGILRFMADLPAAILKRPGFRFRTPSEVALERDAVARLDVPHVVTWADTERDLTAWLGNPMQRSAHEALYALGPRARAATSRPGLLESWRRLTSSDHVYYMCTKWFADGKVHRYFSPYATPHDAFIAFMNVLDDLSRRLPAFEAAVPAPVAERGP